MDELKWQRLKWNRLKPSVAEADAAAHWPAVRMTFSLMWIARTLSLALHAEDVRRRDELVIYLLYKCVCFCVAVLYAAQGCPPSSSLGACVFVYCLFHIFFFIF